ncbi:MAG: CHAD domain-containing protein [Acidobacteriota bacterium]
MARPTPIDTLLTPRAAALTDALALALTGEPDAVHRARVASRRLREVLPALAVDEPESWQPLRDDVRRVTRALGQVRELDVAATYLEAALAAQPIGPGAVAAARRALRVDRAAALRQARTALTPARVARLHARLRAASVRSPAPAAAAVAAALTARVLRGAGRVRKALDRVSTVYVPGRLHAVRIAVKRLRYALEARGAARGTRGSSQLRELRVIQDLLGRAHDLHVLGERLGEVERRVVSRSRAMARDLAGLECALDLECRTLHAAFMSRREALLKLVASLSASPMAARARTVK